MQGEAGQQRESAAADKFDAFLRERSTGLRGWESASDEDVLDRRCWFDSHGTGTKVVHAAGRADVGSNSITCAEKGAIASDGTQSLDKGFVPKLKCANSEALGKNESWDSQEKRGNAADSEIVCRYLRCVQVEQRKVGVTVNQARPMLAPVLLRLVTYMRNSEGTPRTVGERVARIRDASSWRSK